MFLFCFVFAMFCSRLFICALWSPAGKGLTSWLSFVVSSVSLSLSHWYPGSGVVLDCIDSWSLHHYLLLIDSHHSFLCCSPYYLIIRNRVLICNFDFLKIWSTFEKLKLDTKHLQKQTIFLLTITKYAVHTGAEIIHISNKVQGYYKHSNRYMVCK